MAMDGKLVEIAGRNWLTYQILLGGLEIARPEKDRGIDLIVYADSGPELRRFLACPIQMKAASRTTLSLHPKYEKFPNMLLVYVWNLFDSTQTGCYASSYKEALDIAGRLGWIKTNSWITGGRHGIRGYTTTRVSIEATRLLQPYLMTPDRWTERVRSMVRV